MYVGTGSRNIFGKTDSPGGADRFGMSPTDGPSGRRMLLNVSVNTVPIGILVFVVVLFLPDGGTN